MNFLNRLRYGSVALDQEEAATLEYREARKKDYSDEPEDHDYGKSSIPDKYNLGLLEKGKGKYWTTKQYVKEKLGVGEDVFSVAEDEEIDMCVHRARHTQKQAMMLSIALLRYQKILPTLTSKESGLGLLLQAYGESEASAGMPGSDAVLNLGVEEAVRPCRTLMCKLGSALQNDAQMLAELDAPIAKLFNEVETFRGKALLDCLTAVSELNMKKQRFRGALLWMTDAANALSDPDAKKELNNFRDAQHMVKECKREFELASIKVHSKTEMLLSSLNNLFGLHLPGYVSALGSQLKSSEAAYGDIHRWSRENMIHQYKRLAEIQRDRAVAAQALVSNDSGGESGFENAPGPSDDVKFESWANEAGVKQVANGPEGARNLDWLLDEDGDAEQAQSCEKIQDLLIELSSEKADPFGSDLMEASSAHTTSEQRELALECNVSDDLGGLLCGGEIRKITSDEGDLEDIIPMGKLMREQQQRALRREKQIERDLDNLLANLNFDVVTTPEPPTEPVRMAKKPLGSKPSLDSDEQSNQELHSVTNIWAAIENKFIASSVEKPQTVSSLPDTTSETPQGGEPAAAAASKAPISAPLEAKPSLSALKMSSLLDNLKPDADEMTLQGLLALDPDDEDCSVALM